MADLNEYLEVAEALENESENYELLTNYPTKDFYVDDESVINIDYKTIGDMANVISVEGENLSQYVEFKMNRYFDGIDLSEMIINIHCENGNFGTEFTPVNVYKGSNSIKFGWVISNVVTQFETIDLCVWVRGTLPDGNYYVLKTLPKTYNINNGLIIGGGIPEPDENWYLNFVRDMDNKVLIATNSANSAKQSEQKVTEIEISVTEMYEVIQEKSQEANTYYDEIEKIHTEIIEVAESIPTEYTELSEKVDTLESDLEVVNTKVDTIIGQAELNIKNTAKGETIHLDDSSDNKVVEFALHGKATQKSTTGKNLLDISLNEGVENGITYAKNNDGSVRVSGTSTSLSVRQYGTINVKAGTKYILSGGVSENIRVDLRIINTNNDMYHDTAEGVSIISSGNDASFTPNSDAKIQVCIRVLGGVTANGTVYPMVRLATETDPTYEPYTGGAPSPSPEYPQEIEVAGSDGSVGVKSVGKNLIDFLPITEITFGGINFLKSDDCFGTKIVGTSTGEFAQNRRQDYKSIKLKAGKYRFVSFTTGTTNGNKVYAILYVNDVFEASTQDGNKVFTLLEDSNIKFFSVLKESNATVDCVLYAMVCREKDSEEYQPYKETSSTIITPNGLAGIPVDSGGNYTDENGQQWICDEIVRYADGSGEYVQRVLQAELDGSEDEAWYITGTNAEGIYRCAISYYENIIAGTETTLTKKSICSHYIAIPAGNLGTYGLHQGISINPSGRLIIYDEDYSTSDITLWTNNLSQNPISCLFELATPVHTPLTADQLAEIEKLHTYYPATNMMNDGVCGMSVKYVADSKNYIDNVVLSRVAALEALMISNI